MDQALSLLIPGLVVAGMFVAGLLVGRRIVKQPPAPEEVLGDARMEAQRILARAQEEARALADTCSWPERRDLQMSGQAIPTPTAPATPSRPNSTTVLVRAHEGNEFCLAQIVGCFAHL